MSIRQVCDQCGGGHSPEYAGRYWYRVAVGHHAEQHFCSPTCLRDFCTQTIDAKARQDQLTRKALRLEPTA